MSAEDAVPVLSETANASIISGDAFFSLLETQMQTRIPPSLRKILLINGVDCASLLCNVDDNYIRKMENFMKNDLIPDMFDDIQTFAECLGIYSKCQKHFKFLTGQEILLKLMVQSSTALQRNNINRGSDFLVNYYSSSTIVPGASSLNTAQNEESRDKISQSQPKATDTLTITTSKQDHMDQLSRTLHHWIRNKKAFNQVKVIFIYLLIKIISHFIDS